MKLAVIGTGYVGLVTGTCLAEVGHDVTCVDIDSNKINKLKSGQIPIYEPGLDKLVKSNYEAGRLHFTTDLETIGQPQAIFFALPTPPNGDGEADLSFVLKASKDVAKILKTYTVLINKSTVPIGTAQKVHDIIKSNTKAPFDVVSNPEFLREGFAIEDFMKPDRIVVGTTSAKASKIMAKIYEPFTKNGAQLFVMDTASSEMTKYAANSFLAIKLSFMNEVANLCELLGANVDQVKKGIGTDTRIGSKFLNAGIGYGGSCFPKDVMALEKIAQHNNYDFKLLKTVMQVNDRQKHILANKITAVYGKDLSGKTFAVWGLAFKPDTDDIREAPSLEIIRELVSCGAVIKAYDPEATANVHRIMGDTIIYSLTAKEALEGADALLVATEWEEFINFDPKVIAKEVRDKTVFDGRNIFDPPAMAKAGLKYHSIGRPQK